MNCDQLQVITPLYLAGELQDQELSDFQSHIEECRVCADRVREDVQLDAALRSALADETPDASAVVAQVRKQMNVSQRIPRFGWAKIGLAFAASFVLAIASSTWMSAYRHEKAVALAAADDHFSDLVLLRHSDWLVKPTDVAAFFNQQFPQRTGLSGLIAPNRASLEKVRICKLRGASYAHIVLRSGAVETSIFLIANPGLSSEYKAAHLEDGGHGLEVSGFTGSGLSGIVVGQRGLVPTDQIAHQLAERL